ncbi:MAG: hypothetical protein A3J28_16390 [Acidobacteria bacterium RIFCSPLOWO2_12_FULL_60_22]|nr:MAG: hypothetical protein A3J28_16390 [Acidobacteria bacterium RIFCSPLOWO2_12_FULL_60_22]
MSPSAAEEQGGSLAVLLPRADDPAIFLLDENAGALLTFSQFIVEAAGKCSGVWYPSKSGSREQV